MNWTSLYPTLLSEVFFSSFAFLPFYLVSLHPKNNLSRTVRFCILFSVNYKLSSLSELFLFYFLICRFTLPTGFAVAASNCHFCFNFTIVFVVLLLLPPFALLFSNRTVVFTDDIATQTIFLMSIDWLVFTSFKKQIV